MKRPLLAGLLLLLISSSLAAQISLEQGSLEMGPALPLADVQTRIEQIDISNFPSVELRVLVTKTASADKITINNVQLDENGVPQIVEYFDCPEDSIRLSVAILLDRSASMARINNIPDRDSTKMREAKKAISIFLDLLGSRDESALFSFTTQNFTLRHIFTVEQDFTFDAASVKGALVPIAANGGTRLWEAIIDAIKLLKDRKGRRVLIVLTDGRNQFGEAYHTPAIQAAIDAGIPVYTIGLGNDTDVGALSGFAAATGGRFYFAPEAGDLSQVFNSIASALITDACVLRYTSSNPCLDGAKRLIELNLSGNGFNSSADSSYLVPLMLNTVTLSVENGISVTAKDTVSIPLNVAERFSMANSLSYTMTVDYDPDLMHYIRSSVDGTMSQGSSIDVVRTAGGTLEISNLDFFPAIPTGTLYNLVFACNPQSKDTSATVDISNAEVQGLCRTLLSVEDGEIEISACDDSYAIGDSVHVVIPGDGSTVRIPIRVMAAPTAAAIFASFTIDYSGLPFEILGVESEGSRSLVVMHALGPERRLFNVETIEGRLDSVLFYLRVRARNIQHSSSRYVLPIDLLVFSSGCRATVDMDRGPNWGTIFIDGVCEPLLRRKSTASISNHPNPFPAETEVSFEVPVDGAVQLRVMDSNGRIVADLLDTHLKAGVYVHRFNASALPTGEYYAIIVVEGSVTVRRMLLLR